MTIADLPGRRLDPRSPIGEDSRTALLASDRLGEVMKIALYHRGLDEKAEHELSLRMIVAAQRIGSSAAICETSDEIFQFDPDFVLSLHTDFAKITEYPTFGCMWNPPTFFANTPHLVKNIISLDGYLFGSGKIKQYFDDLNFGLKKKMPSGVIYPSCYATPFATRDFERATMAVVGTNWDGPRFNDLMTFLARSPLVNFFGPKGQWEHVGSSYAGCIPFDGGSVVRQLHASGISLSLHRPEHILYGVPNMRLFEAVAACAAVITDDHPFARATFGDLVFYVDQTLPAEHLAEQIADHVATIRSQPDRVQEMVRAAHAIFTEKLSLEVLLRNAGDFAARVAAPASNPQKQARKAPFARLWGNAEEPPAQVDCIVRTGLRDTRFLRRALDSIVAQTFRDIRVIVVNNADSQTVRDVMAEFADRLRMTEIVVERPNGRSDSLWRGLAAVQATYFCILDDDDRYYPNHVAALVARLEEDPTAVLAYGGVVHVLEGHDEETMRSSKVERRSLAYLDRFDAQRLLCRENYITSNAFLARSSTLDAETLVDPELSAVEDYWLLVCLALKGDFIETWEVSSEYYWRRSKTDNISFDRKPFWRGIDRIRTRLQFLRHGAITPISAPFHDPDQIDPNGESREPRDIAFLDTPPPETEDGGWIDAVRSFDDHVEIVGWAPWRGFDRRQSLIVVGLTDGHVLDYEQVPRADVARVKGDWSLYRCGFRLRLMIEDLRPETELSLFASDETGRIVRLGGADRLAAIRLYPPAPAT